MPFKSGLEELAQRVNELEHETRECLQTEKALEEGKEKYRELYIYMHFKRESELYRSFLQSPVDAVMAYDLQGNVLYLNPSFTRSFSRFKRVRN